MRTFLLLAVLSATVGCGASTTSTMPDDYTNSTRSPETNPKTPVSAGMGDAGSEASPGESAPPMTAP